jgi:hypothetical protein
VDRSPFTVLAVRNMCLEQTLLGGDTRVVREARITIHRPHVFPLDTEDLPARFRTKADFDTWAYVQVIFPFTLSRPPNGRKYSDAGFAVAVDAPDVVAVQLDLAPLVPDGSASVSPPDPILLPGGFDNHFRWDLMPPLDGELHWGARLPRAVLQIPPTLTVLSGSISVNAALVDEDINCLKLAMDGPQRFELDLGVGEYRGGRRG